MRHKLDVVAARQGGDLLHLGHAAGPVDVRLYDVAGSRVDGVERAGRFMLMELEINEPYLFLGMASDAAARFADAIEGVL